MGGDWWSTVKNGRDDGTGNVSSNALGALSNDTANREDVSSKALGALCNDTATTSSKALGPLAVAQQDISGAQNCAPEIVALLRRPRA